MVHQELTKNYINCCFEVSSSLILRNNTKPFLTRIVMCYKKCISNNDRRQLAQWLDREESPKCFSKSNLHQNKVTVTVWWSATRLIHHNFLNPSDTITSEKYAQQISEMHRKLQRLQLALVNRKGLILHDNAWSHIVQPVLRKLN